MNYSRGGWSPILGWSILIESERKEESVITYIMIMRKVFTNQNSLASNDLESH